MCGSAPKAKKIEEKPPQYMRNPWLDGLAIGGLSGIRTGRNSLRVDLGGTNAATGLAIPQPPQPVTPPTGAYPAPAGVVNPKAGPNALALLSFAGGGKLGSALLGSRAIR